MKGEKGRGIIHLHDVTPHSGNFPLFWPALILSTLMGTSVAVFKASALNDWVSRCKFSKGEHYDSLEGELKAFNSAAGG